jgi:xylan 1,4-beta-xylosidase
MSVGHGRLVDTPGGKWYMTVHSYENGYRTLGRQLLLLPVEWTTDGWFRVPRRIAADSAIAMPVEGARQQSFVDPSDDFSVPELGLQWGFWREYDAARFTVGNGALTLAARGKSLAETSVLSTAVGGHAYTVEIDVEIESGCEAGLILFYNPEHATGIMLNAEGIGVKIANGYVPTWREKGATRATLRVVNDRQEVDFYFRRPGKGWQRAAESAEISGMQHNVLGGFLDVRPAVYACGAGRATFRSFRYWGEAKVPA